MNGVGFLARLEGITINLSFGRARHGERGERVEGRKFHFMNESVRGVAL